MEDASPDASLDVRDDAAIGADAASSGPVRGRISFQHFTPPMAPDGIHTLSLSFSDTMPVECESPVLATVGSCSRVGPCDPGLDRLSAAEIGVVRLSVGDTEVLATSTTTQVSAPGLPPEGSYTVTLEGGSAVSATSAMATLPPPLEPTFPDRVDRGAGLELRWTPTSAARMEALINTPGAAERVRCVADAAAGVVVIDASLLTDDVLPGDAQISITAVNETPVLGAGLPTMVVMSRSAIVQGIRVE